MQRTLKLAILGAVLALLAPAVRADTFSFQLDLNVASLGTAPNAPFFVDLQLNLGSGSLSNFVTISNITVTGGAFTGSPQLFGNASGSFNSSVSLTDSMASPFNEIFQQFSAGTQDIKFTVTVSQNSAGATPDEVSVSVLDGEPGHPQIGTTAPDGVSLASVSIGAHNTISDVMTATSTSPAAGASTTVAVPEPAITPMLAAALAVFALRRPRSRVAR